METVNNSDTVEALWMSSETYKYLVETESGRLLTDKFPDGMLVIDKGSDDGLVLNCSREQLEILELTELITASPTETPASSAPDPPQ